MYWKRNLNLHLNVDIWYIMWKLIGLKMDIVGSVFSAQLQRYLAVLTKMALIWISWRYFQSTYHVPTFVYLGFTIESTQITKGVLKKILLRIFRYIHVIYQLSPKHYSSHEGNGRLLLNFMSLKMPYRLFLFWTIAPN